MKWLGVFADPFLQAGLALLIAVAVVVAAVETWRRSR